MAIETSHNRVAKEGGKPEWAEPRWPALLAVLAVGGIYMALPNALVIGPRWLLFALVCVLSVPLVITHHSGHHNTNQILAYIVLGVVTAALAGSVGIVVFALPSKEKVDGLELLRSAGALWTTNILVFALWYWRLDGGGPHQRDLLPGHCKGAFLFPQMTMDDDAKARAHQTNWSPGFVDYLFVAFNTSTAFSPTDVPVLTSWAKILMMTQSIISLAVVALLAARGINIL